MRIAAASSQRSRRATSASPSSRSAAVARVRRTPSTHAVGLTDLAGVGERVDDERPLGIVHARSEAAAEAAARALREAYEIGESADVPSPIVLDRIERTR